jgi:double-stranded uracil-DNA glycosylase
MSVPQKASLEAVMRRDARLLILGSLPGDVSLAQKRYYAHPKNQFWRLMERVVQLPLFEMPYPKRIESLLNAHVALWDVVATGERRGSLDSAINGATLNDLPRIIADLRSLRAIAFNGRKAAKLGRPMLQQYPNLVLIDLPSSSPAFTRPISEKADDWLKLSSFLTSSS